MRFIDRCCVLGLSPPEHFGGLGVVGVTQLGGRRRLPTHVQRKNYAKVN